VTQCVELRAVALELATGGADEAFGNCVFWGTPPWKYYLGLEDPRQYGDVPIPPAQVGRLGLPNLNWTREEPRPGPLNNYTVVETARDDRSGADENGRGLPYQRDVVVPGYCYDDVDPT
jgi:hypothetical protein